MLIFPQGTRVLYKERPDFKKGVARIYETLKLPCVPVALNTGKIWPKIVLINILEELQYHFLTLLNQASKKKSF